MSLFTYALTCIYLLNNISYGVAGWYLSAKYIFICLLIYSIFQLDNFELSIRQSISIYLSAHQISLTYHSPIISQEQKINKRPQTGFWISRHSAILTSMRTTVAEYSDSRWWIFRNKWIVTATLAPKLSVLRKVIYVHTCVKRYILFSHCYSITFYNAWLSAELLLPTQEYVNWFLLYHW